MDMTLNDRMNLLSKKRHCFGCLQPLKPQHTNTCDNRFNCRTCSGGIVVYVSKKKKNAEDFQRSKEESVANTFADLKTPSAAEKHQTKVITMCIVALKKDVLHLLCWTIAVRGLLSKKHWLTDYKLMGQRMAIRNKTAKYIYIYI